MRNSFFIDLTTPKHTNLLPFSVACTQSSESALPQLFPAFQTVSKASWRADNDERLLSVLMKPLLLAAELSRHRRAGRSEWELAAFLEQWFMSHAWFVPRLNAVSCSQHRWLERKAWAVETNPRHLSTWGLSGWNKLSVPIARLQPCYHYMFKAVATLMLSGQMNLLA